MPSEPGTRTVTRDELAQALHSRLCAGPHMAYIENEREVREFGQCDFDADAIWAALPLEDGLEELRAAAEAVIESSNMIRHANGSRALHVDRDTMFALAAALWHGEVRAALAAPQPEPEEKP